MSLELARQLAAMVTNTGLKITCAESCTGGGIASALTDIAGSSRWFEYGFVTYANVAKVRLLGVAETTLEQHGAVSEAVVREMAAGALAYSGADVAVAVSGIAGPDGGSLEKPVGTVWFAWQYGSKPARVKCYLFTGNRAEIRRQAVEEGLRGLLQIINNKEEG